MSGVQSVGSASGSQAPRGMSALTTEEFSKIIFTELANQDPMSPNDTGALLQQISTLRSIQSDMDLSDRLKALVQQNQFASAAGLMGKLVSGISETGERVAETVAGVSRTDEGVVVTLTGGHRVRMSHLDMVVGELPQQEGAGR
jgi:flagellar basal-body rod modification protein FlgD